MILKKISILSDNYVWILCDHNGSCIIIDPGLSEPIIQKIEEKNWDPVAILLTHNHMDHTQGVKKIVKRFPKIVVFGPLETKEYSVDRIVHQGDKIILLNKIFYVLFTPGHTLGHVSYYRRPYIFCGDTLFSAGCGKVYKNKHLDMYRSIRIISSLPDKTLLCCSHEYTLSNLKFSMSILPDDDLINSHFDKIKKRLKIEKSSLPSYIFEEKKFNLFLRTNENVVKKAVGLKFNNSDFEVFLKLRLKKDFWS